MTAKHLCHAPGCETAVQPRIFACRTHWFALPKALRAAIQREYRPGQEIDKQPSPHYLAVQRLACSRLAFKPNDAGAAKQAGALLVEALAYRKEAMAEDDARDPLAGLLDVPLVPLKAEVGIVDARPPAALRRGSR